MIVRQVVSRVFTVASGSTAYAGVGPVPSGYRLIRLAVEVSNANVVSLDVSPVLSGSLAENATGHAAGVAVIRQSSTLVNGRPSFHQELFAGGVVKSTLTLALDALSGPQYVLVGVTSGVSATSTSVNLELEIESVVELGDTRQTPVTAGASVLEAASDLRPPSLPTIGGPPPTTATGFGARGGGGSPSSVGV